MREVSDSQMIIKGLSPLRFTHPSAGIDEQMYSDLPWMFWETLFTSIFFGYKPLFDKESAFPRGKFDWLCGDSIPF
jgi:hypothetical protein